jgi:hypothetical protein
MDKPSQLRSRRQWIQYSLSALGATQLGLGADSPNGELLYNGIRLPGIWPPADIPLTTEPQPTPPYLLNPPEVIPIDVGRQLFVDDFLVEHTDLRRVFGQPEYYSANPVLRADKKWEFSKGVGFAMPVSDGVFYDPADNLFKLWYRNELGVLYATSRDGVHWEKPELDVRTGTNAVFVGTRASSTVWLDHDETNPARRFKLFYTSGHDKPFFLHYSADGIHWGDPVGQSKTPCGDRTTAFYNPFRKVWVYSIRDHDWTPNSKEENPQHIGRYRAYWEHKDALEGLAFSPNDKKVWTMADRLDKRRIDLNVRPQLYNLDAVAYESIMLGYFTVWYGQGDDREKPNQVLAGFSRDGFHWDRSNRKPFFPVSERFGDWNYSNVQSAGGACIVVGDRLYFYCAGRDGLEGIRTTGQTSTGLAVLRRDGFAAMNAGFRTGTLTTRPLRFSGKHLFVNLETTGGDLRVEVLDQNGKPIAPFTASECIPLRIDNTLQSVTWKNAKDLSAVADRPVRFRFHLRSGDLYAFWVSPDRSGASYGFVGAGGPGFTGSRDTVGSKAYQSCCTPAAW